MTAMMMSIASTGGSPGASWKPKTRISVPTPPHRPRPTTPERTPRAMKPMTTRPWRAINAQPSGFTMPPLRLQVDARRRAAEGGHELLVELGDLAHGLHAGGERVADGVGGARHGGQG